MNYKKCHTCQHSDIEYSYNIAIGRKNAGLTITCKITGKSITIDKCPYRE